METYLPSKNVITGQTPQLSFLGNGITHSPFSPAFWNKTLPKFWMVLDPKNTQKPVFTRPALRQQSRNKCILDSGLKEPKGVNEGWPQSTGSPPLPRKCHWGPRDSGGSCLRKCMCVSVLMLQLHTHTCRKSRSILFWRHSMKFLITFFKKNIMVKVTFQWKHKRRNILHQNIMATVISEHFRQSIQSLRTKQGGKTSHPLWPLSKTQKATTTGRCGKLETPCTAGGNADWTRLWKTVRVNTQSPHQRAIPHVGVHLKNWEQSGSHLSSCGHVGSYCGSVSEEATKCLPMDEQVSKTWSTHTMGYFKPWKGREFWHCTNTGEPSGQHAEWKEAVTDTHRVVLLRGGNWSE